MVTSVLGSTLLLTLLLLVGLLFFIRASVKDRTEVAKFIAEQPEEVTLEQLQQYFTQRAYYPIALDATQKQITLEGFVRPSWFLAIFLTLLAAIGILCLSLVLSLLLPKFSVVLPGLAVLAPLAGLFYWRQAGRKERVLLSVDADSNASAATRSIITLTAHRDEVAALQQNQPLYRKA